MPLDNASLPVELRTLTYGQTKVLSSGIKEQCTLEFKGGPKNDFEPELYEQFGKNADLTVRLKFDCDKLSSIEPYARVKRGGKIEVQEPNGKLVGAYINIDPLIFEIADDDEKIEEEMRKETPFLFDDEEESSISGLRTDRMLDIVEMSIDENAMDKIAKIYEKMNKANKATIDDLLAKMNGKNKKQKEAFVENMKKLAKLGKI